MTRPAQLPVRLAGACSLRFRENDGASLTVNIPRLNKNGGNNADALIDHVLHFAVRRHGKRKARQIMRDVLAQYPARHDFAGLPDARPPKRRDGPTLDMMKPGLSRMDEFTRHDVAKILADLEDCAITASHLQIAGRMLKWAKEDGLVQQTVARGKKYRFVTRI